MSYVVRKPPRIDSFRLPTGLLLAGKYEIVSRLGGGWEGEVYKVRERGTGIERAVKLFFPQRNPRKRASRFYARKLHRLRHCPIVIQYYTEETVEFDGFPITALVSEFVEGELLSSFLNRQPGHRLVPFAGVHLLHSLATGIDGIHRLREYHGDLHADNIIVGRYGLKFELKLLDMYRWEAPRRANTQDDLCDLIRLFYDAVGGARLYRNQPPEIKAICCGLKRSLILKKFPTVSRLKEHLENMTWG